MNINSLDNMKENSSYINQRHIHKALHMMRKAYTEARNPIDLEFHQDFNQINTPESLATYNDLDSVKMKPLSLLKSEAKIDYQMFCEKAKQLEKSNKIGKPRRIYPSVVEKITQDIKESKRLKRIRQNLRRKRHREVHTESGLESSEESDKEDNQDNENENLNSFHSNHDDIQPINKPITLKRPLTASSALHHSLISPLHTITSRSRPSSPNGLPTNECVDVKLQRVLETRRNLIELREKEILDKFIGNSLKEDAKEQIQRHLQLQKIWLTIIMLMKPVR